MLSRRDGRGRRGRSRARPPAGRDSGSKRRGRPGRVSSRPRSRTARSAAGKPACRPTSARTAPPPGRRRGAASPQAFGAWRRGSTSGWPTRGKSAKCASAASAVGLVPGADLLEGVHADEKDQFRSRREAAGQFAERLDRVGFPSPAHLEIDRAEGGVAADREAHQREAFGPGGEVPPLVRREVRGDEQDPLEIEPLPDLLGEGQVGDVDGIEGAPVDADAARPDHHRDFRRSPTSAGPKGSRPKILASTASMVAQLRRMRSSMSVRPRL